MEATREGVAEKVVLPGPASKELGEAIARRLSLPLLPCEVKVFPDGETRLRFEEKVSGKTVLIVQSTYPPPDHNLFQLLLASHRLSQEGAKVHAVVPYLAYARQDKEFVAGEVVSLGVVSHLLRSGGVSRLTTVDIHSAEGLSLFAMPVYSVSAIPSLVSYVKKNFKLNQPVVVAPDFGGSKRSEAFASLLQAMFVQLSKKRDRVTGQVKVESSKLEVKGRDVLVVDDIISTGGTVRAAGIVLREAGAARVIAVCSHPLLVGDAMEKLESAGIREVVGTNTVPSEVSKVDVSEAIAEHLKTVTE